MQHAVQFSVREHIVATFLPELKCGRLAAVQLLRIDDEGLLAAAAAGGTVRPCLLVQNKLFLLVPADGLQVNSRFLHDCVSRKEIFY